MSLAAWQYGEIYVKIAQQFQKDWGVKVNQSISGFSDYPTKFTTLFAGGTPIDVAMGGPVELYSYIGQGMVEPIDGLPGVDDYVKDFTTITRQAGLHNGKTWGLPYFSAVWVWNYYETLLEKAKIHKPFSTYDELIEQCVKAKKDKVSEYPILWVAGAGPEQLPGTWYSMTWNRGSTLFDKQGNHQLGPGSVAREVLKYWRSTFVDTKIADPESLKVQFTGSAKAFMAGKNLYRGPNHHYGLNLINDPGQSPIAGKVKAHGFPGDGRTIGTTNFYFMTSAFENKDWAWKLLQYVGGRTKDGEYTQAIRLAKDAMLGSGFKSVMNSDAVSRGWAPWGDVKKLQAIWEKGSYLGEVVPTIAQPWYGAWTDILNIEVQKTLSGQTTADECCDNIIDGIKRAKRSV